jgi:hypothetical protein
MGAELFHEDQQIDMTKRAVAFRHFFKDDKITKVFHTLHMFRTISYDKEPLFALQHSFVCLSIRSSLCCLSYERIFLYNTH